MNNECRGETEIRFKNIGGQKTCQRTIKNALPLDTAHWLMGNNPSTWHFPARRREAPKSALLSSHARNTPTERASLLTERTRVLMCEWHLWSAGKWRKSGSFWGAAPLPRADLDWNNSKYCIYNKTYSVDMYLSKLWEIVKDRGIWGAAVHGAQRVRQNWANKQQQ